LIWVSKLGKITLSLINRIGRMGLFLAKAFLCAITPPFKFSWFIKQIWFIGFQSTLVIFLTGAFSGMVLGLQGFYTLNRFGSTALLGPMVALSIIKDLGPVLSALMVTGRAGSAMTAEIGIMRIREQIESLESMGIDPVKFLIHPRLLGAIVSGPGLKALFHGVGG